MLLYITKRIAAGVLLLLVVITLIFVALHLVPGDPARTILSTAGSAPSEEAVAQLRAQLGLDLPLLQQYLRYVGGFLHGSLGTSLQDGTPVATLIGQRLPRTLQLVAATTLLSSVAGMLLGTAAARRGGIWDRIVLAGTSLGVSIPSYVAAILLVNLLAVKFRILPYGGYNDWSDGPRAFFTTLTLPALALSVGFTSIVARMTRSSYLESAQQEWVRTAQAIGLRAGAVSRRHILRNALTPVLTVTGLQMGGLLGGTIIVERVFNWPGLSGLLIDGISYRDYPVVQGVVVVIAAFFILLNLIVDLLYGALDPRSRQV